MEQGGVVNKNIKGISPLLTVMILVVAVILAAIIAINWVWGVWNITKEEFMLRSYLYITHQSLSAKPILKIYVINEGMKSDKIIRAEIIATNGKYVFKGDILIEPGMKGYIVIGDDEEWDQEGNPELIPGENYLVKIYTERHGMHFFMVNVQFA